MRVVRGCGVYRDVEQATNGIADTKRGTSRAFLVGWPAPSQWSTSGSKRKPHQDNGDRDKRRHQEEALDEALKNTFPASDPVSVEQPTTSGRSCRS